MKRLTIILFFVFFTTVFTGIGIAQSNNVKGSNNVGLNNVSLNDFFKDLEGQIENFGKDIEKEVNQAAGQIEDQFKDVENQIQKAGDQLGSDIENSLNDIAGNIEKAGTDLGDDINKALTGAADDLNSGINDFSDDLNKQSVDIMDQLDNATASATGSVNSTIDLVNQTASNTLPDENDVKKIDSQINTFLKDLESQLQKFSDKLKENINSSKNSVDTRIDKTSADITNDFKVISNDLEKSYKDGVEQVKNFNVGDDLEKEFDKLKDALKKMGKDIEGSVEDVGTELKNIGNDFSKNFEKAFSNTVEDIEKQSTTLTNMILKDLNIDKTLQSSGLSTSNNTVATSSSASDTEQVITDIVKPPFTWGTDPYPGEDKNNYCGQYAMATVMNSLGLDGDFAEIYKDTNPAGIFTAPPTIENYLNSQGVDASISQNASIDDMKAQLDTGKPAMILCDSGGCPHWVAVMGYTVDSNGKTSFQVCDSYWGIKNRSTGIADIDEDEFKTIWEKPLGDGALGTVTNYSNLMVSINGTKEPSSPSIIQLPNSTNTEDAIGGGICDVVSGWTNKQPGKVIKGIANVAAGIPGALVNIPGKFLNSGGTSLDNWGKEKMDKGGFFNTLLGGAARGLGKTGEVTGKVLEYAGNAASAVGQTVVNGVSSAVTGVKNFFKGLF